METSAQAALVAHDHGSQYNNPARRDGNDGPTSCVIDANLQVTIQQSRSSGWKPRVSSCSISLSLWSQYNNPARRDGNYQAEQNDGTHYEICHNTTIPLVGMETRLFRCTHQNRTCVTIQQSRSSGWKPGSRGNGSAHSRGGWSQYNNPARRDGNPCGVASNSREFLVTIQQSRSSGWKLIDMSIMITTMSHPGHNTTIPLVGMETGG